LKVKEQKNAEMFFKQAEILEERGKCKTGVLRGKLCLVV
jgi:hypothetical protein